MSSKTSKRNKRRVNTHDDDVDKKVEGNLDTKEKAEKPERINKTEKHGKHLKDDESDIQSMQPEETEINTDDMANTNKEKEPETADINSAENTNGDNTITSIEQQNSRKEQSKIQKHNHKHENDEQNKNSVDDTQGADKVCENINIYDLKEIKDNENDHNCAVTDQKQILSDQKQTESDQKQTEFDEKQTQSDEKQTQSDEKQFESDEKQFESDEKVLQSDQKEEDINIQCEYLNQEISDQNILNNQVQQDDSSCDIEPIYYLEDTELQLVSESGSEASIAIERGSGSTHSSQQRYIPARKSPSHCFTSEVRVNVTRLNFKQEFSKYGAIENETEGDTVANMKTYLNKTDDKERDNESDQAPASSGKNDSELFESFSPDNSNLDTNVSILANYSGNNTTRNFDITTGSTLDESNIPSFIQTTKDLSYGETLRCLSGRRPTRPVPGYNYDGRFYKSNIELPTNTEVDAKRELAAQPKILLKRKLMQDSSEEIVKRPKCETAVKPETVEQITGGREENSGLFSKFGSPFKSMSSRPDIPSSTPKLIHFKHVEESETTMIDEEEKEVPLPEDEKINAEKKWCLIM